MLHELHVREGPIQDAGPLADVRRQDVPDRVRTVRFGGSGEKTCERKDTHQKGNGGNEMKS